MAPISPLPYIIGKTIPYLVISFVSAILVILSAMLLFDLPMRGSWLLLCGAIGLFLIGAQAQGLLISTIADTQQVAFQIALLSSLLPTMILSGFIFPISSMPIVVQWITHIVPARYFLVALRSIVLKGADITAFWQDMVALVIFATEFGRIEIGPGEICVIPRGVIFRTELVDGPARAYVCENYGGGFTLPDRGPIGANCLANPRDFLAPVAAYEDREAPSRLYVKWGGDLFVTEIGQSPLDIVAWHGNYYPYKYDLRTFSPVNAVLFDHPDPSIFTVLTSQSETPGTANIDFVIFPERWSVAEDTFRPPWYHRNIMSEFMGLVYGVYDAKPEGFVPGGISLHNQMLPHGPDATAFEHASNTELKPVKMTGTLAFMFETRFPQRVTRYAAGLSTLQPDYADCWAGLKKHFDPTRR